MTSAQRRNVIILAAALLVGMLAIGGWARGNSGYSCGELIDAMQAESYETTGRAATPAELEMAYNTDACSGGTSSDLSEDEIMDLVR